MSWDEDRWLERCARAEARRLELRYFVYFLLDANGGVVYVGRSCNVANRIRAHAADGANPHFEKNHGYRKDWIYECRSVQMVGPFDWDGAVAREAAEIARHQPRGNRAGTLRDHRLSVATRSRMIAEAQA